MVDDCSIIKDPQMLLDYRNTPALTTPFQYVQTLYLSVLDLNDLPRLLQAWVLNNTQSSTTVVTPPIPKQQEGYLQ